MERLDYRHQTAGLWKTLNTPHLNFGFSPQRHRVIINKKYNVLPISLIKSVTEANFINLNAWNLTRQWVVIR